MKLLTILMALLLTACQAEQAYDSEQSSGDSSSRSSGVSRSAGSEGDESGLSEHTPKTVYGQSINSAKSLSEDLEARDAKQRDQFEQLEEGR